MLLYVVHDTPPVFVNIAEDVGFVARLHGVRARVRSIPVSPATLDPERYAIIYVAHSDPAFPSMHTYTAITAQRGIRTVMYTTAEGYLAETTTAMKYARYVAVSNYVYARLQDAGLDVVGVVYPGVDFTLLKRIDKRIGREFMRNYGVDPDRHIVATTIAQDLPRKGLAWLGKIIARVAEKDSRVKFFVVTTPTAQRHFAGLGSAVAVSLKYGELEREDVLSVIAASHIYVMPSLVEGFGMPVLEAMALGVPVVHADLPPLVEFSVGFSVYARDVVQFRQTRPYMSQIIYEHYLYDVGEFAETVIQVADMIRRETIADWRAKAVERAKQFDATRQYKQLIRYVVDDI